MDNIARASKRQFIRAATADEGGLGERRARAAFRSLYGDDHGVVVEHEGYGVWNVSRPTPVSHDCPVVWISHSAPLTAGGVEWFVVKPNPQGLEDELTRLRRSGRAVIPVYDAWPWGQRP